MNKLKKLFGPTTMVRTVATVMLAHSAMNAFAGWFAVSTANNRFVPNVWNVCGNSYCSAYCEDRDEWAFWCCADYLNSCPNHNGYLLNCDPFDDPLQGLCYQQ